MKLTVGQLRDLREDKIARKRLGKLSRHPVSSVFTDLLEEVRESIYYKQRTRWSSNHDIFYSIKYAQALKDKEEKFNKNIVESC